MTIYPKEMVSVSQRDNSSAVVIAAQRASAKMRKLESHRDERKGSYYLEKHTLHHYSVAGTRKLYHLQ